MDTVTISTEEYKKLTTVYNAISTIKAEIESISAPQFSFVLGRCDANLCSTDKVIEIIDRHTNV